MDPLDSYLLPQRDPGEGAGEGVETSQDRVVVLVILVEIFEQLLAGFLREEKPLNQSFSPLCRFTVFSPITGTAFDRISNLSVFIN